MAFVQRYPQLAIKCWAMINLIRMSPFWSLLHLKETDVFANHPTPSLYKQILHVNIQIL